MNIKHDYSYLSTCNRDKLIEKGFADLDIHSLNFDRFYTEEQKQENYNFAQTVTKEQWSEHCEEISKSIYTKLLPIVELLNSKFTLYQYNSNVSYNSNWDLFFYSNKGWNEKDYFDHMEISFNDRRTVEENKLLLSEVLQILESLDVTGIQCRVQYKARKEDEKIKNKANEIIENLLNKNITYQGFEGKIKVVSEHNGTKEYGFFKKRARSKYYKICNEYLVLNFT